MLSEGFATAQGKVNKKSGEAVLQYLVQTCLL